MDFVYNELGYKKEQTLHSIVHLDEETPHLHCVVIPLVKKLDKRTNTERFTISKKQYIRDNFHLSELQDKYYKKLTEKGYDLERGIKGSNAKHQKTKELKKTTRYYEKKVDEINTKIDNAMSDFEDKMKTAKNIPFNKTHVLVEKETFDSMNNVIKETKKAMDFGLKLHQLFNEVDNYTKSHQTLEKENQSMQKEIKSLKTRNHNLTEENNKLNHYIKAVLEAIKSFFRQILLIGNEPSKEATTSEIKEYYDTKILK
ncbi:MAG: plasmid recombination protein [Bacilli bacterium]